MTHSLLCMLIIPSAPRFTLWAAVALCLAAAHASAQESLARRAGESAHSFAVRVAPDSAPLAHGVMTTAAWGGTAPAILAFYAHSWTAPGDREPREVVTGYAYVPAESPGRYRRVRIGRIESEGGTPRVRSVFLARADADTIPEVVVLVEWPVLHYDVSGTLYGTFVYRYAVRAAAGAQEATGFTWLERLSEQVSGSCACEWRDGRRAGSRFTTAVEVRRELARLRRMNGRGRAPGGT
ncbi:MAG: hypothetical protein M3P51_02090 [Chloroflexota bacterium]|nr:hypothetical protein [Chloroflexota bacterium]